MSSSLTTLSLKPSKIRMTQGFNCECISKISRPNVCSELVSPLNVPRNTCLLGALDVRWNLSIRHRSFVVVNMMSKSLGHHYIRAQIFEHSEGQPSCCPKIPLRGVQLRLRPKETCDARTKHKQNQTLPIDPLPRLKIVSR